MVFGGKDMMLCVAAYAKDTRHTIPACVAEFYLFIGLFVSHTIGLYQDTHRCSKMETLRTKRIMVQAIKVHLFEHHKDHYISKS